MKEATVELVALPLSANIPIIFPQHVTKTWKSREMNTPDCWEQLRIVLSLYFWSEQTAGRIQWSLFFQIYTLLSKKPIHHWLNPATSKDIKLHTYTSQLSYPSFFGGGSETTWNYFFPGYVFITALLYMFTWKKQMQIEDQGTHSCLLRDI